MSFDFPNAPTVGQAYSSYVWDGEKWVGGAQGSTVYVSDSAPAAPVGALWFESDTGILYVHYNDGNSTQWVAVVTPGVDAGAVRFDGAQTLTTTQQTQARKNVYAAPLDALAYNGIQINGNFEVSQWVANDIAVTAPTNGAWTKVVDGWNVVVNTAAAATFNAYQYSANVPPGSNRSLLFQCSTGGVASPGASDYFLVTQAIEGYRTIRLGWGASNAQPITIGFWLYTYVAGSFSVSVQNSVAPNRAYIAPLIASPAGGWNYYTVTIPGDVTGTWSKDNTVGIYLMICFGAGASLTGPTGVWSQNATFAANGVSNFFPVQPAFIIMSSVSILPGAVVLAPAPASLVQRPYDQELLTCQRYYETIIASSPTASGVFFSAVWSGVNSLTSWNFRTRKRAIPTFSLAPGAAWQGAVGPPSVTPSVDQVFFQNTNGSYYLLGTAGAVSAIADARL